MDKERSTETLPSKDVKKYTNIDSTQETKQYDETKADIDKKDNDDKREFKKDTPQIETKANLLNTQMEGKNRLQPASEDDKVINKANTANDSINQATELITMVMNETVSKLDTTTNLLAIESVPLSSYKFEKVDRSVQGGYGISPFVISKTIPQLFKFVTTYNEAQQVNLPDLVTMKFSTQDVTEIVAKSIEVFNISTMTVRIALNDKLSTMQILDPNSIAEGSMVLQTVDRAARENPQASVNFVENRIFAVIRAFLALDNVLIAMPKKITVLDNVRGGPTANALVEMPFYDGMLPHLYYSVFSNLPEWARTTINELFRDCPLQIGDTTVTSYDGMKLAQFNKVIIDQYTAAYLRLNFQKICNHALTSNALQEKIKACMMEHDKLELQMLIDTQEFSLLYNWTDVEYNLFMFNVLTDQTTKQTLTSFLVEELEKTNRLKISPIEEIWKGLTVADSYSIDFNSKWVRSLNIGNSRSGYEMLVYETFADWFTFELPFPAIPNSLEALTEVFNIYIFMILYPRITQRVIHTIGYRLKTLYEIMFPSIYRNFRNEFGEVRTDYGEKVFKADSYEIKPAESQAGYIYSIFVPQTRTKKSDRDATNILSQSASDLLNKFVTLLTSLRNIVLPEICPVTLERKRIARYPYMLTEYTAYSSWKPISLNDYSTAKIFSLGDKLASLLTLADSFKTLFSQQNQDSSQLPRTFNLYFSVWTNTVARIVSTAGAAYQVTCAGLQNTLFNTPFFVYSSFNPDPKRFFFVQRSIGIGPLSSASLSSIIVPRPIIISGFKLNVATNFALTLEGEYLRNLMVPAHEAGNIQEPSRRIRTDITIFDGVAAFKELNALMSKARRYGFAMQVTQWLTTPTNIENPFGFLVSEVAQYMKMASWAPLVKRVFTEFGLNFEHYFTANMGPSAMILDGRYLDRSVVLVDPATSTAVVNPPLNTKFGFRFDYMVPYDIEKLSVISRPFISPGSKIMRIKNDWYFGRLFVSELHPTQRNLERANWSDKTTINQYFAIKRFKYKGGQSTILEYMSEVDDVIKTIILPYTDVSVPVLLIQMEYLTELQLIYLDVIAKAIVQGKIVLRVKGLKVKVNIIDMPTRTIDYSEPNWTYERVYDLLNNPSGCIIEHTFPSTISASNYQAQSLVCSGYIQWLATPTTTDPSLFVSTITNAVFRPVQTILPTADELGYGPDPQGLYFNNNTLKSQSDLINFNNIIPTLSENLPMEVAVKSIAYIPQFLGTF